ncbi:alpha/beta hydrolase [Dactylosporangium roseum]|uniref:Alpha/beta hydrolase n=1 Tax=Dactylosporangium roseum TaxID=47989 RepID=A0ABY5ZCX1_9ACTN|nr:alpha/beta hydrolase [Dactylosporangium roseum]UWZ39983.1 alpha/beta hydrolase [Dactylosporangium roseum]
MPTVISADGTTIAYERTGDGPALVLVDGAMCHRAFGPMRPLAEHLKERFTVYTYDRRGRGESGDTLPFAVDREVEDIRALVAAAGGTACLYGMSSGAALVMAAAARGGGITRIALYEPPFVAEVDSADGDGGGSAKRYTEQLTEALAEGRKGDAVALFLSRVGMPPEQVAGFRASPGWAPLEAIGHTLAYDDAACNGGHVPIGIASSIRVPTLVLGGGASPQVLQDGARAAAEAIPGAVHRTLDGQTHDVAPAALAPVLAEFLLAGSQ